MTSEGTPPPTGLQKRETNAQSSIFQGFITSGTRYYPRQIKPVTGFPLQPGSASGYAKFTGQSYL
ncbi:hypothetical protein A3D78_06995 [Candidatus Gottesmanbacteria bacterium RIFCSPHIGHO2_02_FULL_39_14]|uniref:Uncharacterized protein n=1 Tax=Candidatus Gottesmanbacteria bacterium RIFCSPHIGHO2_02_FULL_39_14 TaxID=1798383 RepID=A0A1F5ZTV2_9BACT|nr:MAG: hypothetical protein A3D78_06995 [Candidatus Gottesmanbacteria bacterium RIFCSPHIGHO2_02_FULL_39_14]